jgi:cobalt-zinc-cadmium efflux system protein
MSRARFSYGFGRTTILAALANVIAILIGVGAVVLESVQRFSEPIVVPAVPVLIVAGVGIAINASTAMPLRVRIVMMISTRKGVSPYDG